MEINTPEDWWRLFNNCKEDILSILYDNLDTYGTFEGSTNGAKIETAILEKDHDNLLRFMNAAWFNAPEEYCWSVPNWGNFCDLMSEEWVFDEHIRS
jgi:hypothetical protein